MAQFPSKLYPGVHSLVNLEDLRFHCGDGSGLMVGVMMVLLSVGVIIACHTSRPRLWLVLD